jgi:MFS family permease
LWIRFAKCRRTGTSVETPKPRDLSPHRYDSPPLRLAARLARLTLPAQTSEEGLPPVEQIPPQEPKHDPYAAFRHKPYVYFVASFMLAAIAGQMTSTTVALQIYAHTGNPLDLGLVGGIQALPLLLLALPAGQVADTYSRRRIVMITQAIGLIGSVALASLALAGWLVLPLIYSILLVNACAATFQRPARSAIMPALVPKGDFTNAVTWNSTLFETCNAVGPTAAGLIVAAGGPAWTLWIAVGALVLSWVLVFKLPDLKPQGTPPERSLASLFTGVKFVYRSKLMFAAMALDLFAVLLGGAVFLLPIFAKDLGWGEVGFGFLKAAPSIGAIAMAVGIAHLPPFRRAGRTMLGAVAVFGLATVVFGLSRNFYLSFAMLVICGMADNVSVVVRHTLVQTLTPDSMRGRVSAVNQIFIGSSNEIGGLESGVTAWWLGHVRSVVYGGLGTIAVVAVIALKYPQVRRLGMLKDVQPEPLDAPEIEKGFAQKPN